MYCSKVIFEVIFWKIAILFLWSNTFLLSTRKTVRVRGIHVRHYTWPYDVLMTATGGEIRLYARVRAHRLGVNKLHPKLNFSLETEVNSSINFLDLTVTNNITDTHPIYSENPSQQLLYTQHFILPHTT